MDFPNKTDRCIIIIVIGGPSGTFGKGKDIDEAMRNALHEAGRKYKLRKYIIYDCPADCIVNPWNEFMYDKEKYKSSPPILLEKKVD